MMVVQPYEYTNHWIYTKQFTQNITECIINDANDSMWIIERVDKEYTTEKQCIFIWIRAGWPVF